jgi:hypothetical protein
VANVEVTRVRVGTTDRSTQDVLRESLENMQDLDDPSETFRALDIRYLTDTARAVDESC